MRNGRALKQQTILMAAEGLFSAQGYQNTTVAQIARASGMAESSIYEYFEGKEDLLFAIPEKYLTELHESLNRHLMGIRRAANKLSKFIWHYLMFMEDRPVYARLFMLNVWSNRRFYQSPRSKPLFIYWNMLGDIIGEGMREGEFDNSLEMMLIQSAVLGTMNHFILSALVLGRPMRFVDKAPILEKVLLEAVKGRREDHLLLWGLKGKKADILRAALKEFGERGYSQTTVAQISAQAGISDPTLYEYFRGKEEILMAIPEHAVDGLISGFKASLGEINTPESVLKLFLWQQADSYDRYQVYYRVLLEEIRCNPAFYQTRGYAFLRRYAGEFTDIVKQGIEAGRFREDMDLSGISHLYFGLFDHLLLYSVVWPGRMSGISEKMSGIYRLLDNVLGR